MIRDFADKGLSLLHEPWRANHSSELKLPVSPDGRPTKNPVFACLTDQELRMWQENFLRRFGTSSLNPKVSFWTDIVGLHAWDSEVDEYRNNHYYVETTKEGSERLSFSLRPAYREINELDLKFEKQGEEGGFWTPDEVSETLLEYFTKKYASLNNAPLKEGALSSKGLNKNNFEPPLHTATASRFQRIS